MRFCTDCQHYLDTNADEELGFCNKLKADVGIESTPRSPDCYKEK